MKHRIASYRVRTGQAPEIKKAIAELISSIRKSEWGVLSYDAFQLEDPNVFLHVMAFEDEEAERQHFGSPHVERFMDRLTKLSDNGAELSSLALMGSIEHLAV